jgi:hypothetical protein
VKEGAEELAGCVPLHHLTDNASLATMLLETYKVRTSLAEPRAETVEIILPPGAGAEIMNCGSGFFLFIKDLKIFYRKKSRLLKKCL